MRRKVLVAYATRHGATRGIAERIATILAAEGLDCRVASVRDAPDPTIVDAVVIGSAAYFGNWLREAKRWSQANSATLRGRPVWLFTSGPVGPPSEETKREALLPRARSDLERLLKPRGHVVFAGAFDPRNRPRSIGERVMRLMPASRDLLPPGDWREWDLIEAWSRGVAREVKGAP